MTDEDKQIVADYMNWPEDEMLVGYCTGPDRMAHFDANDAALCIVEMQKRGEFRNYTDWTVYQTNQHLPGIKSGDTYYYDANFIAWLFNAKNFFKAFTEWRKK